MYAPIKDNISKDPTIEGVKFDIPSATYGPYNEVIFHFSDEVLSSQAQTSTKQVRDVTNAWIPKIRMWTGTRGCSDMG